MIKKSAIGLATLFACVYVFLVVYTNYIQPPTHVDGGAAARAFVKSHGKFEREYREKKESVVNSPLLELQEKQLEEEREKPSLILD